MDGSILMVVELGGCLIVPEIFINYALILVYLIFIFTIEKNFNHFFTKMMEYRLTDYCCLILIRWREDESFKRG